MTKLETDDSFTCMHDVLEALEAVIASSDPDKREALAASLDGYADTFPEDFHWSIGAQAPALLQHLMMVIDWSCRPDTQSKAKPAIRLVDRKPAGNA